MTKRIFQAGFVWRVIENKWEGFEDAFEGFEPRRWQMMSDGDLDRLVQDERIVRNARKILSVRDNARLLCELAAERGAAAAVFARHLQGLTIDHMEELTYYGRKRVHNLKYFTWVEQQGKSVKELEDQWTHDSYWSGIKDKVDEIDHLIDEFNERTGLLSKI